MKINSPFAAIPPTNSERHSPSSFTLSEESAPHSRTSEINGLGSCIQRNEVLNDLDHRMLQLEEQSHTAIKAFKNHCDKIHISYRGAVHAHNAVVAAVSERRVMSKTYSVYPWIRFSLDFLTKIPLAIGLSTPVLITTGVLHPKNVTVEMTIGIVFLSLFVGMVAASIRDVVKKGQENDQKEKMKIDPLKGMNKPTLVADRYNRIKIRFEVCLRLKIKALHEQRAAIAKCLARDTQVKQKHINKANKHAQSFADIEQTLMLLFQLPYLPSSDEMQALFERRIWAEWIFEKSADPIERDNNAHHKLNDISFKSDRKGNIYFPVEVVQRLQALGILEIWKKRPGKKYTPKACPVVTEGYIKSFGESINEHFRAWLFSQSYRLVPEVFKRVQLWVEQERSKSHPFRQLQAHLKQVSPHDYLMYFKEDMVYHLFVHANLKAINDD